VAVRPPYPALRQSAPSLARRRSHPSTGYRHSRTDKRAGPYRARVARAVLAALRDTRGRKPAPPARSGRDWAYGPCPMAAARMRRSRLCGACQKRRVRCSWSLKLQRCRPGKRANGRRGSPDSAFQRAKRESLDDMALSEGHHKDRRDGGEERGGGHLAIADVVFLREAGDADGDRVRVGGARQAEREQKFLPAKDENQHG